MKREYKYIIIGAGASGLMLSSLIEDKSEILIIESNSTMGKKISISGGGKCNLTNEHVDASNYLGVEWFVQSVLDRFDQQKVLEWFSDRGVVPSIRKDGQYFCQKSADEVVGVFRRESSDVDMAMQTTVERVSKVDNRFIVDTNNTQFISEHLIVASGGLSFPRIGASSIGFDIANTFGHTINRLSPALVGFTVQPEQFFFKELSGSSIPVTIATDKKSFRGDLLFAHKGISGPSVLNASLHWHKGTVSIDFVPGFSWETLASSQKNISTVLPLPKKIAKAFLEHLQIGDKKAEKLSTQELDRLKILSHYTFAPAGTFGYSKAEVTRGGVSTAEIDPYNMMSTKEDNLYFIGEVLDVTGELGGYNFQWAFSSAFCCAESMSKSLL